jgi:hypothetical protein
MVVTSRMHVLTKLGTPLTAVEYWSYNWTEPGSCRESCSVRANENLRENKIEYHSEELAVSD